MKFSAAKNTLAFHLEARPFTSRINFGDLSAKAVGTAAQAYLKDHQIVQPEGEAIAFYLCSQAFAALRKKRRLHEPLPDAELDLVKSIYRNGNAAFLRLLYYVTVICVRECRHLKNHATVKNKAPVDLKEAIEFINTVPDSAEQAMQHFLDGVSASLTMVRLAKAMAFAFHKGSWSHGYGGPAWGKIADTLVQVLDGEITPEMFCDLGWALCHNGGPIFNKGMFYLQFSKHQLIMLLDIQRAGQMPQYVNTQTKNVTAPMKQFLHTVKTVIGGAEWDGPLDWEKVIAAGPQGEYEHFLTEAQKQAKLSESQKAQKAKTDALYAELAAKQEAEKAADQSVKAKWDYLPGKTIKVFDREGYKKVYANG